MGIYAGPIIYGVFPLMLLLMYRKGMHLEILLGFFFILTMSDSRLHQMAFAGSIKNIYIVFIAFVTYREASSISNPVIIFKNFIPFFLVAFLCVSFSPNMSLSFQKTLSYVLLFICMPNYFLFVYSRDRDALLSAIVFFVGLLLGLGLIINLFSPETTALGGRYRGLLGNPNGLGLFTFLFIVFFATINEHYKSLFTKYGKMFIYGLAFFSLIKCGARGSLMSVLLFFFFNKFYKISPAVGFVIFILSLFVYQLVSNNLTDIIISLGLGEQLRVETLENGSGRLVAWKFAWDQIQENFYFGKGFNYTDYLYREYYEYLSKLGHEGSAHNSYLTIWLDTGLVGLFAYCIALIVTFLKAAQKSKLAIPFLYAILFSNYYESWLTASLNPFTIQFLFILTAIFTYDYFSLEARDESDANVEKQSISAY